MPLLFSAALAALFLVPATPAGPFETHVKTVPSAGDGTTSAQVELPGDRWFFIIRVGDQPEVARKGIKPTPAAISDPAPAQRGEPNTSGKDS